MKRPSFSSRKKNHLWQLLKFSYVWRMWTVVSFLDDVTWSNMEGFFKISSEEVADDEKGGLVSRRRRAANRRSEK